MNGLLITGIGVWIFFIASALHVRFRERSTAQKRIRH
jgi:hypothetical protein